MTSDLERSGASKDVNDDGRYYQSREETKKSTAEGLTARQMKLVCLLAPSELKDRSNWWTERKAQQSAQGGQTGSAAAEVAKSEIGTIDESVYSKTPTDKNEEDQTELITKSNKASPPPLPPRR
jgi:hypothetical protein